MNIADQIHGFRVEAIEQIPEMEMTAYRFTHLKSGADLLWLSCEDENRAFSISFKTLPQDSTGVFHILEHSVLCGSDKFPLREPFVDLIKGSLSTFLNAMTYPDKTMYPVASTNEKDFINLIDVYMDAVLHTRIYSRDEIFMQEGWHYEAGKDGSPAAFSGVVYNEMKGSLSSPDSVFYETIQNQMLPDTPYAFNSGGDPKNIPDLTYEQFIATHKKFYSPENSYIYLYGKIDLDEVLGFLNDKYLSSYEKKGISFEIAKQAPIGDRTVHEVYELGEGESIEGNTILGRSVMLGDYSDRKTLMGMRLLLSALTSSNAAPLKRAILDANLGDEFSAWVDDGIYQPYLTFRLKKTDAAKTERFLEVLEQTLERLADEGIDRELLLATINQQEFELREKDTGLAPGVIYAISVMDSWLYGGSPTEPLKNRAILQEIREDMEQGYFEDLIKTRLINHDHALTLILEPSATRSQERLAEEARAVAAYEERIGREGIAAWEEKRKRLNAFQTTEDTPEVRAMLPHLDRKDLDRQYKEPDVETETVRGVPHRFYHMPTSGITYLRMYFDISHIPLEDMPYVSLLSRVLFRLSTKKRDMLSYLNDVDKNLGSLTASTDGYTECTTQKSYHPQLTVICSFLEENYGQAKRLITEGVSDAEFVPGELAELIRQEKAYYDAAIVRNGDSYAIRRARSYLFTDALYEEMTEGIAFGEFLRDLCEDLDQKIAEVCEKLSSLVKTVFQRKTAVVSFLGTTDAKAAYLASPTECYFAEVDLTPKIAPLPKPLCEGVRIPGSVVYDAMVADLAPAGIPYSGVLPVLSKILSYDYLWNEVRVQGGAYGTRAQFARGGYIALSSYRDPHVERTYQAFTNIPNYLEQFSADESEMTKYVIGTVSILDHPFLPKQQAYLADVRAFLGLTREMMQKYREETIDTTSDQIRSYAEPIRAALSNAVKCTVGAGDKVTDAKNLFDEIR